VDFAAPDRKDSMADQSSVSSEMVLFIRNSFIDCEGTVGDLLTTDDRAALCNPPGGLRRSRSTPDLQMKHVHSSPMLQVEASSQTFDLPDVRGCLDEEMACEPPVSRKPSVGSFASTGYADSLYSRDRLTSNSSIGTDSSWEDPMISDAGCSTEAQGSLAVRAERGEWSVGAEGHALQRCTPCAFLDSRKGCLRGSACTYCHLCEPGEKRRRLKAEKRSLLMQRQAQRRIAKAMQHMVR